MRVRLFTPRQRVRLIIAFAATAMVALWVVYF
jgi:hypothetical protein